MVVFKYLFYILFSFLLISCNRNVPDEYTIYFDSQKKGANYFNKIPDEDWFVNAKSNNIKLVRLAYDKWDGKGRDFLIYDADNYQGIVEEDFEILLDMLEGARDCDIKVIITPLTLPGARWSQKNNNVSDGRLYEDIKYQEDAIRFWVDLATRLKDNTSVVAYNILNEPHPEKFYGKSTFWLGNYTEWYESIKGTPADLNLFYKKVIEAIRSVDKDKFIVLDSGLHATPWAFEILEKQNDEKVLYSFHMYEPYEYTTQKINRNRFTYPGNIFINDANSNAYMDRTCLEETFLAPVVEWSKKNKVPHNRIMVGEFGVSRLSLGSDVYINDIVNLFNKYKWHFLFYAFQEDEWDNMDYQFGDEKLPYQYWLFQDANTLEENRPKLYEKVRRTPVWDILKKELDSISNV